MTRPRDKLAPTKDPKSDAATGSQGETGWENGNGHADLTKLFALMKLDDWTFQSCHPAYSPGGFTRAYGGHVYAQAGLAAGRTVKEGFCIHSITGHFLLLGVTDLPFVYRVSVLREGGGYVQRRVDATQDSDERVVFTCVCSFKTSEKSINERTRTKDLGKQYESVLKGKELDSLPEAPGVDSPFWWKIEEEMGVDPYPGLDMRKPDMTAYNQSRSTLDRRQLQYYRVRGEMPSTKDDSMMHATGHLYASDRNGLFAIPNFLERGDDYSAVASLNHTVIFHVEAEGMSLVDQSGKPKWFCLEETIDDISHGRALAICKIWDVQTGKPIASTMQDGLVRMKEGVYQNMDGLFSGKSTTKTPDVGKAKI